MYNNLSRRKTINKRRIIARRRSSRFLKKPRVYKPHLKYENGMWSLISNGEVWVRACYIKDIQGIIND